MRESLWDLGWNWRFLEGRLDDMNWAQRAYDRWQRTTHRVRPATALDVVSDARAEILVGQILFDEKAR